MVTVLVKGPLVNRQEEENPKRDMQQKNKVQNQGGLIWESWRR